MHPCNYEQTNYAEYCKYYCKGCNKGFFVRNYA